MKYNNELKFINTEVKYDIRERIKCPKCNLYNTVFNSERNNKIRIKCKDCNKGSSVKTAPYSSNIISGEG